MKKILFLFFLVLSSCVSIKSHNEHIDDLISEKDLQSDVDFLKKKLDKLQPKLNWYISKEKLDAKWDSLKTTINQPLKSKDFYEKLAPVVKYIGQGHLSLKPYTKLLTAQETKKLNKQGVGPLSQFEFENFDNRLYIVKNKSYDKSIKIGTEVIAFDDKKSTDLIKKYKTWFASDGYNTTYLNKKTGKGFSNIFFAENGIKDSITYTFKTSESQKTVVIKRRIVDSTNIKRKLKKISLTKIEKDSIKLLEKKKIYLGYNKTTEEFQHNLSYSTKDSSVAVMKINGFSSGNYRKFYKKSFREIKKAKTKTLILDLRNNTGGKLNDISNLYNYLADTTYVFLKKSEVKSRTSLFSGLNFREGSVATKIVKGVLSPVYYGICLFKTHKGKEGNFYVSNSDTKLKKPNRDAFKGKIYVLINGASFSASSIISSNLKGSKRAYFVGEETGGAHNGTVAGIMPQIPLPKSKIKARIGLLAIIPQYNQGIEGRGIFPDKEIVPTLQDRINQKDPEMEWVINEINPLKALK
jgi:Peptidase family S41